MSATTFTPKIAGETITAAKLNTTFTNAAAQSSNVDGENTGAESINREHIDMAAGKVSILNSASMSADLGSLTITGAGSDSFSTYTLDSQAVELTFSSNNTLRVGDVIRVGFTQRFGKMIVDYGNNVNRIESQWQLALFYTYDTGSGDVEAQLTPTYSGSGHIADSLFWVTETGALDAHTPAAGRRAWSRCSMSDILINDTANKVIKKITAKIRIENTNNQFDLDYCHLYAQLIRG
jgi:hypothetical protein